MKNKKPKFCETLLPGYYYLRTKNVHRCFYATGTTRGNKWIDLTDPKPQWMDLLWNCMSSDEIIASTFHTENPTACSFNFKWL